VQCAWRDDGCHLPPLRFLFIAGEMLRIRVNPVGLDALDLFHGHHSGQVRVLALVFVIAPTEGVTVQVHPWGEHDLMPVMSCFIAEDLA